MDEFNCVQFLNNNNDLLPAEQLLSDDFPTLDVSFNQMVADYSPNVAAVPHGLKSTGTKTKTTTTATTQQDKAADVSRFSVVSNKDIEELKSVAVNKNTASSRKQWRNVFTVPVKCKLTVSTRSSKLDSRVSNVETFEFRDARIEDRVSSIEKHRVFEYANSKRTSRKRFISQRMNNSRSHT